MCEELDDILVAAQGMGAAPGMRAAPGMVAAPGMGAAPGMEAAAGMRAFPEMGAAPAMGAAPGMVAAPGTGASDDVGASLAMRLDETRLAAHRHNQMVHPQVVSKQQELQPQVAAWDFVLQEVPVPSLKRTRFGGEGG